ncbi:MAG: hypothetical protein HYV29_00820 [Ignavibacteriales bacterium]|nr:hypothetical protein [Ignavibacteriales bacterium]
MNKNFYDRVTADFSLRHYGRRDLKVAATFLSIGLFFIGCGSSLNVPSVEESEKNIAETIPRLDSIDHIIVAQTQSLPKGFDIISHTRMSAINTLLYGMTNAQSNDIHFECLPMSRSKGRGRSESQANTPASLPAQLRRSIFISMSSCNFPSLPLIPITFA